MRYAIVLALCASALVLAAPSQAGNLDRMSYEQLAQVGNRAIQKGHVYSSRWGDASPWLKSICYEMVERAFAPYGNSSWALYIVNRESGCNPGAINSSSGANGIAQILQSHDQYNHWRIRHDLRYAVRVFVHMSGGGKHVRPWAL